MSRERARGKSNLKAEPSPTGPQSNTQMFLLEWRRLLLGALWYGGTTGGDVATRGPVVCVCGRVLALRVHDRTTTVRTLREHTTTTHTPRRCRHHRNSHTAARRRRENGRLRRFTPRARRRRRARQATGQCPAHRPERSPRRRDANARRRRRRRGRCIAVATEVTVAPPLHGTAAQRTARAPTHPTTHGRHPRTRQEATGRATGATESYAAVRHH